ELAATHPPRILMTTDGTNFTPVNGHPGTLDSAFGQLPAVGYRAMAVYNNRLFVTASTSLTGDGVVMEITNPTSANPTFTQVSPNTMAVYEMATFNGHLYIGNGDLNLS